MLLLWLLFHYGILLPGVSGSCFWLRHESARAPLRDDTAMLKDRRSAEAPTIRNRTNNGSISWCCMFPANSQVSMFMIFHDNGPLDIILPFDATPGYSNVCTDTGSSFYFKSCALRNL